MAVPDYQSLMLPLLKLAAQKGSETSTGKAVETLATILQLTENELKEMLPSGTQSTFANRVGWSATYLKKAGLLEATRRGFFQVTQRGNELLLTKPTLIDVKPLNQYPEFREFRERKISRNNESKSFSDASIDTPSEALEEAYENLRKALADELLTRLKKVSPTFFERVVVELLVKMGYGGSRADAGKAIGRSGDGGIDGIIKEDWVLMWSIFRPSVGVLIR